MGARKGADSHRSILHRPCAGSRRGRFSAKSQRVARFSLIMRQPLS
jgi:hypothetical protein